MARKPKTKTNKTAPSPEEQKQIDLQNAQLANNIIQIMDQPVNRPSLLAGDDGRNAKLYQYGMQLMIALAKGEVVIREAEKET